MSEAVRERLERLREETDADSLADVLRRALAVYDLLCKETKGGARIVLQKPDEEDKLVVLV